MKLIKNDEALSIIGKLGVEAVYEFEELKKSIEYNDEVLCFLDELSILIVNKDTRDYVSIIPLRNSVNIESIIDFLMNNCVRPIVLFNMVSLSEKSLDDYKDHLNRFLYYDRTIVDFASVNPVAHSNDNVRLLTPEDSEIFCSIDDEFYPGRPPLKKLFDIFVNNSQGYILGYFLKNKIIGYISFAKMGDYYLDVDYVFVSPDHRGQHYSNRLADAYVQYAYTNKFNAYWSNAQNIMSIKAAKSAGMHLVRKVYKFCAKKE